MATGLTRWDPFSELTNMRSAMDRLFDQRLSRFPNVRGGDDLDSASIGLDVSETSESYVVKAALAGVDPSEVDISVEDDVLTIKGEFKHETTGDSDETPIRRELHWGAFTRSLRLPPTVDAEHAHAEFEHGLLRLTLPKRSEARARSIKITPAGAADAEQAPQN